MLDIRMSVLTSFVALALSTNPTAPGVSATLLITSTSELIDSGRLLLPESRFLIQIDLILEGVFPRYL